MPDTRSPGWLNFVPRRLICVEPQCGKCRLTLCCLVETELHFDTAATTFMVENLSALKTERAPPSETSVGLYQSIRHKTPEDGIILVSYSIVYCSWVWDIECLFP